MKKAMLVFASLLVICLLLAACDSPAGTTISTTTAGTTAGTTVFDEGGIGGTGSLEMESRSIYNFSVESAVWSLVDPDEYKTWQDSFVGNSETGTRDPYEFNMYTLITEFSIPRDKIEQICKYYHEEFGGVYFTDEQVEAIYNGTEEEVYRLFANPYAVMVGKQAYSPQWMVEHKAEEYLEVGITHDILTAEFEELLVPCTEEQRAHLRAQLKELEELNN